MKGTIPWKVAYVANVVGRNAKTLFIDNGQIRSAWRFESVAGNGRPVPWLTFPAIAFVGGIDLTNARVLEFGSGASTEYWSARVREVCSVEGDAEWGARVAARNLPNSRQVVESDPAAYADAGRSFGGTYDLILIDGIERAACARTALDLIAADGVIILDNSDVHPDAREVLAGDSRFVPIDFEGFGPINGYPHVTTAFISRTTSRLR